MAGPHQPGRDATTDLPNQINNVCIYVRMYVCMFLGLLSENIGFADHRHDGCGFLSVVSNVLICRDSPTPTFWILSLKDYDYIVGFVAYISKTESWS